MPNRFDRPKPRRQFPWGKVLVGIGIALIAAVVLTLFIGASFINEQTRSCTVISKDRATVVTDGESKNEMRVYTEQCDVMKIEDNAIRGVWDSASIYGKLKEGETYQFTTVGFRVPFLSAFPTVIEVR